MGTCQLDRCEIARQELWLGLRHHEHGASRGREVVAGGIHLAEVGVAGDSDQVAEEDEQEVFAIEKRRQPDAFAIRPQEGEVRGNVAGGHFLSFSSWKVIGASSRPLPPS